MTSKTTSSIELGPADGAPHRKTMPKDGSYSIPTYLLKSANLVQPKLTYYTKINWFLFNAPTTFTFQN